MEQQYVIEREQKIGSVTLSDLEVFATVNKHIIEAGRSGSTMQSISKETNNVIRLMQTEGIPTSKEEITDWVRKGEKLNLGKFSTVENMLNRILEKYPEGNAELEDDAASFIATVAQKHGIMFSEYFRGSNKAEIANVIIPTLEKSADPAMNPLTMFLYLSKSGSNKSVQNTADLSEYVLLGRLALTGHKQLVVYDEFEIDRGFVGYDNSAYVKRLVEIGAGLGIAVTVEKPIYDQMSYSNALKSMQQIGHASLMKGDIPKDNYGDRLYSTYRFAFNAENRAEADSIDFETKCNDSMRFTAFCMAKRPVGENSFYVSVTAKNGRLKVGWPYGLLPLNGIPLIFEKASEKDPSKKYGMILVPRDWISNEFRSVNNLGKHVITGEDGSVLAHVLTEPATNFDNAAAKAALKCILAKRGLSYINMRNIDSLNTAIAELMRK